MGEYFYVSIKKKKTENKNKKRIKSNYELIFNDKKEISNDSIIQLIIIGLLYAFYDILMQISYSMGLSDFDLWIFNIVFTLIFMSYYFSINIYNHQKYSLSFIVCIDLVLLILATFFPSKKDNSYNQIKKLFNNKLYSIVIFLIFILKSIIISYSRVLSKVILEYKFISRYSIIIIFGIFGFILTSILITITSIFKCGSSENYKIICNIDSTSSENKYYDSIPIYFKNLKKEKDLYFWIEVLIIYPLYLIINFLDINYELLTIYYLSPVYVLINDSLFYGLVSLFSFLLNFNEETYVKSLIYLVANMISFFGYSIYVEIIELNFCMLNNDLRKNIIERSRLDSIEEINENCFESKENDDDDEIKTNENQGDIELGIIKIK